MSSILRVQWTIEPRQTPRPWLNCNRCGKITLFESSGKVRINAQGKRLDAWLIYNCASCSNSWNLPIFERRRVRDVDPAFLDALFGNVQDCVRRLAFNVENLRRHTNQVEQSMEIDVRKQAPGDAPSSPDALEISLIVTFRTGLRLDRLLATELALSRARIQELTAHGILKLDPGGPRALKQPVRGGTRVCIALAEVGIDEISTASALPAPLITRLT